MATRSAHWWERWMAGLFDDEEGAPRKDLHRTLRLLVDIAYSLEDPSAQQARLADAAQGELSYDDARDLYEELYRWCSAIERERASGAFEAERAAVAGSMRLVGPATPIHERLNPWLASEAVWDQAIAALVPRMDALRVAVERMAQSAVAQVRSSAAMAAPEHAHLRAAGVDGAKEWLDAELLGGGGATPCPPRGDVEMARLRDVLRAAVFLPQRSREAWKARAQAALARFDDYATRCRALLSQVEIARRLARLAAGVGALQRWAGALPSAALARKPRSQGLTVQYRLRLDAAQAVAERLNLAQANVDVLHDWAGAAFTQASVGLPALVAVLALAFTANVASQSAQSPGTAVLRSGWDFFDIAHPERLAALAAIGLAVGLFFVLQLCWLRTRGRLLPYALVPTGVIAAVLAFGAGSAVLQWRLRHASASSAGAALSIADLRKQDYVCYGGFGLVDRVGDFIVLGRTRESCAGAGPCPTDTLLLPKQRIEALSAAEEAACVKFVSAPTSAPPVAAPAALNLSGALELKSSLPLPPIALTLKAPSLAADPALRRSVDGQAAALRDNTSRLKALQDSLDDSLKRLVDATLSETRLGTELGHDLCFSLKTASAQNRLLHCREHERVSSGALQRVQRSLRGVSPDICFEGFQSEIAQAQTECAKQEG